MKRLIAALALLLGISLPVHGRERISGWCEQGGNTVTVGGLTSTEDVQESFASCTVTVYDVGTLDIASIFSDDSGTVRANPFTAASTGFWFWYADDARYDIRFSGGGISTPFTLGDFLVDDTKNDVTTIVAVSSSATPTFDASLGTIFTNTLTENVTSSTITNPVTGQRITLYLVQDGVGGFTFAWPANVQLRKSTYVVADDASAVSVIKLYYDGTNWRELSRDADEVGFVLTPVTTLDDFGTTARRWDVFMGALDISGDTTGNIVPAVTAQDLGSASNRWDGFFQDVLVGNWNNVRVVVTNGEFTTIAAAVTDACAASPTAPVFVPTGTYTLSASILPCSGLNLFGAGRESTILQLANAADVDVVQLANGTTDVTISHLTINGNRANQTSSTISGVAINSTTGSPSSRIIIHDLYVLSVRDDGIRVDGASTDILITQNIVDGTDVGSGIQLATGTDTSTRIVVSNNIVRNSDEGGIVSTGPLTHSTITGNVIDTTVDADCITAYNQDNAFITVTANVCRNSGNHGIHVTGDDISISSNIIESPTNNGIFLSHSAESPPSQATRISVANNSTTGGVIGISVFNVRSVSLTGNTIDGPSNSGIQHTIDTTATASDYFTIVGNVIRGATNDGIGLRDGVNHGSVVGNLLEGSGRDGIRIADTGTANTNIIVALNRATGNTGFGINELNNASDNLFFGNHLAGNTAGTKSLLTGGAFFETEDSLLASSEGSFSNTPRWTFKLVDHTDLVAAATGDDFVLWTLPANTMIHDVVGTVVTAWAGTGPVTAAVCSVGTAAGSANDLTLDDDFFATGTRYELHDATASGGKGTLLFDATDKFAPFMLVASGNIEIQCDLTGGDHDNTTAGQARIYILVSQPLANTTTEAN